MPSGQRVPLVLDSRSSASSLTDTRFGSGLLHRSPDPGRFITPLGGPVGRLTAWADSCLLDHAVWHLTRVLWRQGRVQLQRRLEPAWNPPMPTASAVVPPEGDLRKLHLKYITYEGAP